MSIRRILHLILALSLALGWLAAPAQTASAVGLAPVVCTRSDWPLYSVMTLGAQAVSAKSAMNPKRYMKPPEIMPQS